MKFFFKLNFFALFFLIFFNKILYADNTYFIDFTKVLNQSKAGAEAQEKLKKKFDSENKKFVIEEQNIKNEEIELISQKKVLSNDEYQKKVENLRKKVAKIQNDKQLSLNEIAKTRANARQELLKNVNPIIKQYMEDNGIRLLVDKQSVVLGDTSLEITDNIINILNQKLSSIKLN
jgi:outer membrane protein